MNDSRIFLETGKEYSGERIFWGKNKEFCMEIRILRI